jgi:hypothetical protein
MKCPFCGSEKIKIETPYLNKHGETIMTFCCSAQKQNEKYVKAHTSRMTGDKPSVEDVIKF